MLLLTNRTARNKDQLPPEIYISIVDSLFGNYAALMAGTACVAIAATLTALKTQSVLLWFCALAILLIGIVRAVQLRTYARLRHPLSIEGARAWEARYTIGTVAACGMLGVWCFVGIAMTDDPTVHLLCSTVTVANIAAGASRIAGRPHMVVLTILSACVPLAAALLLHADVYYVGLGILLSLFFLGLNRITAGLHETNLKAVIASRDVASLAKRFDTALNNMPHGLCMCDAEGRIEVFNHRLAELLGIAPDYARAGITMRELIDHCVEIGALSQRGAEHILMRLKARDGSESAADRAFEVAGVRTFAFSVEMMENGGSVFVVEDITERKNAEAKINHMARFDAVTGLPNRSFFHDQLASALLANRGINTCAVLFIDLDQFKQVNDTLGHPVGDRLLCAVAERLHDIVRPTDIVARFGGDEFVVFRPSIRHVNEASLLAERIVVQLGLPYMIDHHQVVIGASVGIATNNAETITADSLMKYADMALYRAKSDGRSTWRFFEEEMAIKAQSRRGLELDLRNAVAAEGFELYYQPLLNLKTLRISTCEALLRWRHPERGMISPGEFIPLAEEMGLIGTIGVWVLKQACLEAMKWPGDVRIAVNLSPIQFKRGDVYESVMDALRQSGLAPNRLELEITESVLLQDTAATRAVLTKLRDAGVRISLDDFGTGYSSLSYLHRFPLQKVKIDRSFLSGSEGAGRSATLLHGVARLCADLGMSVVVEGIETEEQLDLVSREPTITEAQGFLFSKPIPRSQIGDLLKAATPYLRKVA